MPLIRYSSPNPEYKEPLQAEWILRHVVYLPVNTALKKEDMK